MISIGLILHNEESQVLGCLDSIKEALPNDREYEIIIVDNNSQDKTVELVQTWLRQNAVPALVIEESENNIGRARQIAISNSRGRFIYFTDADCRLSPGHIENLVLAFEHLEKSNIPVAAVGGGNRAPTSNKFWRIINLLKTTPFGHFGSAQMKQYRGTTTTPHLSTCNVLYQVEAVKRAGGFSPRYNLVGEDLDLSYRMSKANSPLYAVGSSEVIHLLPTSFGGWFSKMIKYGRGQSLVYIPKFELTYRLLPLYLLFLFLIFLLKSPGMALAMVFGYIFVSLLIAIKTTKDQIEINAFEFAYALIGTHICYLIGEVLGFFEVLRSIFKNSTRRPK